MPQGCKLCSIACLGMIISFGSILADLQEKTNELNVARHLLYENSRPSGPYKIRYEGKTFVVYPNVFSPKYFPDTFWFEKHLDIPPGSSFLEIGPGSGLIAVMAALKGAGQVTAVDISPAAVKNTAENALLNQVSKKIRIYEGDVFDPIPSGQRFDVIFWFAPFMHVNMVKENLTDLEKSIFDPNYRSVRKYLSQAKKYLSPNGKLYLGFSSTHGDVNVLSQIAKDSGWALKVVAEEETHVPKISGLQEIDPIQVVLFELTPETADVYPERSAGNMRG